MKFATLILCGLSVLFPTSSWGWLGVKTPASHARAADPAAVSPASPASPDSAASVDSPASPAKVAFKPRPADSTPLSRQVMFIPAGSRGDYLGTLDGVRCFNCAPDMVQLNLGDSVSREAAVISLRIEAWNAIERPVKDRRMFDYGNRCFYFGYKDVDTVFVGGEWTAVRVQDIPCYPYLRRLRQAPMAAQPVAAVPEGADKPPMPGAAPTTRKPSETPLRSARQEETEAEPIVP